MITQENAEVKRSGVFNQERITGTSNREILANAFEEVAQPPYERSRIREYRKEVQRLDGLQEQLQELNARIQEMEGDAKQVSRFGTLWSCRCREQLQASIHRILALNHSNPDTKEKS